MQLNNVGLYETIYLENYANNMSHLIVTFQLMSFCNVFLVQKGDTYITHTDRHIASLCTVENVFIFLDTWEV